MIKVIIFDLGNVLVKIDNSRVLPQLSQYIRNSSDFPNLEKLLYYGYKEPDTETEKFFHSLHNNFHLGGISKEQFFQQLKTKLKFSDDFTISKFEMIWPARFYRIEGSIEILKKLNKYKRYLLSDTNELDAQYIKKHHSDIFWEFDRIFFSHEYKSDKSTQDAWKNVLHESREHPNTHIFIDDREEYIQQAQNMGMQGVLFENPQDLMQRLITMNVTIE